MTKLQARRLGHVGFETPHFDRQISYYSDVIGLKLTSSDANSACFTTRMGQLALYLKRGSRPHCSTVSFELSASDYEAAKATLISTGVAFDVATDRYPGLPSVITFADPDGQKIDLFGGQDFLEPGPAVGIAPIKVGHIALMVKDPARSAQFYQETLGFRISDRVGNDGVFLRCGPDHHTLNLLRGTKLCMHHLAFELVDSSHLIESCDILGSSRLAIEWGPVRHGPGHNLATYHRNPDSQIIELFTDIDRISDETLGYFDPQPWHHDRPQRPTTWAADQSRNFWGMPMPLTMRTVPGMTGD